MESLIVRTGSSSLEGTATIVKAEKMTTFDLELSSPLVQLDDFIFDNWSWTNEELGENGAVESGEKEPDKTAVAEKTKEKKKKYKNKKCRKRDCNNGRNSD